MAIFVHFHDLDDDSDCPLFYAICNFALLFRPSSEIVSPLEPDGWANV
jgi:hypothetical protein